MKTLIEVGAYDGTDSLKYHKNGYAVYTFEPKKIYSRILLKKQNILQIIQ